MGPKIVANICLCDFQSFDGKQRHANHGHRIEQTKSNCIGDDWKKSMFLIFLLFFVSLSYLFIVVQVLLLSIHDLSILNEFQMPDPLSFREEGGSSMHPDGTKFISVSHLQLLFCFRF